MSDLNNLTLPDTSQAQQTATGFLQNILANMQSIVAQGLVMVLFGIILFFVGEFVISYFIGKRGIINYIISFFIVVFTAIWWIPFISGFLK